MVNISFKFNKQKNESSKFRVGDKVYQVYSTTSEPVIKEYIVKQIFYNIDSILLIDDKGIEKKIYKDTIKTLLNKSEALKRAQELKPVEYAKDSNFEVRCFYCGEIIYITKYNKCSKCGGYKCKKCKRCFCYVK